MDIAFLESMKQANTKEAFQVTEQHKGKTLVMYRDKLNDQTLEPVWISKGLLAKHFHESRVIGSSKGVWIVSL